MVIGESLRYSQTSVETQQGNIIFKGVNSRDFFFSYLVLLWAKYIKGISEKVFFFIRSYFITLKLVNLNNRRVKYSKYIPVAATSKVQVEKYSGHWKARTLAQW